MNIHPASAVTSDVEHPVPTSRRRTLPGQNPIPWSADHRDLRARLSLHCPTSAGASAAATYPGFQPAAPIH